MNDCAKYCWTALAMLLLALLTAMSPALAAMAADMLRPAAAAALKRCRALAARLGGAR